MRKLLLLAGLGLALAASVAAAGPPVAIDASSAYVATVDQALTVTGNTAFATVISAQEVPAPGAIAVAKLDADSSANNGALGIAPYVGMLAVVRAPGDARLAALYFLFDNSPPTRFDT